MIGKRLDLNDLLINFNRLKHGICAANKYGQIPPTPFTVLKMEGVNFRRS